MGLFHRQWASAAIASVGIIAIVACGDDKGVASLEQFYAPGASSSGDGESSSSGSSGTSSSGGPSDVTCGISTTGLVAYLPFDGDAEVRGGDDFSLTSVGSTPRFVSGERGNALDGSTQIFLRAQTSVSLSSWTACAWVRLNGAAAMGFLAVPSPTVLNSGFGINGSTAECGNGSLAPYASSPNFGCFSPSNTSGTLVSGGWTFVCLVNDGSRGQMRWDVDGSSDTRGSNIPLQVPSGMSIAIGGGFEGSSIDEFTLWSRALSQSETTHLASESSCRLNGESR